MLVLTIPDAITALFTMLTHGVCGIYEKYDHGKLTCYQSAWDFSPAPVSLSYPVCCRDLDWQQ